MHKRAQEGNIPNFIVPEGENIASDDKHGLST